MPTPGCPFALVSLCKSRSFTGDVQQACEQPGFSVPAQSGCKYLRSIVKKHPKLQQSRQGATLPSPSLEPQVQLLWALASRLRRPPAAVTAGPFASCPAPNRGEQGRPLAPAVLPPQGHHRPCTPTKLKLLANGQPCNGEAALSSMQTCVLVRLPAPSSDFHRPCSCHHPCADHPPLPPSPPPCHQAPGGLSGSHAGPVSLEPIQLQVYERQALVNDYSPFATADRGRPNQPSVPASYLANGGMQQAGTAAAALGGVFPGAGSGQAGAAAFAGGGRLQRSASAPLAKRHPGSPEEPPSDQVLARLQRTQQELQARRSCFGLPSWPACACDAGVRYEGWLLWWSSARRLCFNAPHVAEPCPSSYAPGQLQRQRAEQAEWAAAAQQLLRACGQRCRRQGRHSTRSSSSSGAAPCRRCTPKRASSGGRHLWISSPATTWAKRFPACRPAWGPFSSSSRVGRRGGQHTRLSVHSSRHSGKQCGQRSSGAGKCSVRQRSGHGGRRSGSRRRRGKTSGGRRRGSGWRGVAGRSRRSRRGSSGPSSTGRWSAAPRSCRSRRRQSSGRWLHRSSGSCRLCGTFTPNRHQWACRHPACRPSTAPAREAAAAAAAALLRRRRPSLLSWRNRCVGVRAGWLVGFTPGGCTWALALPAATLPPAACHHTRHGSPLHARQGESGPHTRERAAVPDNSSARLPRLHPEHLCVAIIELPNWPLPACRTACRWTFCRWTASSSWRCVCFVLARGKGLQLGWWLA